MSRYSAVYAIYNIVYSVGMLAASAIASAAARTLGLGGVLVSISVVLVVSTVLLARTGNAVPASASRESPP
jgi:hypothetical protein